MKTNQNKEMFGSHDVKIFYSIYFTLYTDRKGYNDSSCLIKTFPKLLYEMCIQKC